MYTHLRVALRVGVSGAHPRPSSPQPSVVGLPGVVGEPAAVLLLSVGLLAAAGSLVAPERRGRGWARD